MPRHTPKERAKNVSRKIRTLRKEGVPQRAAVGKAFGILRGRKKKR